MNRRQAREETFKILFEMLINEQELDETQIPNNNYMIKVLPEILKYKHEIDVKISEHLINWTIERVAPIEKTILRIAVYEILYMDDVPHAVSINEAVELAHIYGDEQSAKFINGVLSKIVKGDQ